jgi:hypothetical protein
LLLLFIEKQDGLDGLEKREVLLRSTRIRMHHFSSREIFVAAVFCFLVHCDHHNLPSIANVLLQSGSPVPDWILKLPKPSKMKRRLMGKVKRPDTVNVARNVGKRVALKKRYV